MIKKLKSLPIFLLFSAACSGGALAQPSMTPSSPQFDSISVSHGACYGGCAVYKVTVFSDGKVKYLGERFVQVIGPRDSTISKGDLDMLVATLRYVKLEELRDQYVSEKDGCVRIATDHPSLAISLTARGMKKNVVVDFGCYGASEAIGKLSWLASTIDFVAKPPIRGIQGKSE